MIIERKNQRTQYKTCKRLLTVLKNYTLYSYDLVTLDNWETYVYTYDMVTEIHTFTNIMNSKEEKYKLFRGREETRYIKVK